MQWFETWFNDTYAKVYRHRNELEAKRAVEFIAKYFPLTKSPLAKNARVLDIACGSGRHLNFLAEYFEQPLGLDLSSSSLRRAQEFLSQQGAHCSLLQADMRALPLLSGTFDLICNFFNSFGYFASDEVNLQVLSEWRRCLKPGGILSIDYLNKTALISNLVANSQRQVEELTIEERRELSPDRMQLRKQIIVRSATSEETYEENLRLYDLEDWKALSHSAGLELFDYYGDFDASAWESETSPRLIMFFRAPQ